MKRFSVNFTLLTLCLDIGFTIVALWLSEQLRIAPWIPFYPLSTAAWPAWIFWSVPFIWAFAFLLLSAYEPTKTYRAVDEFQIVGLGIGLGALFVSGLLYLTARSVSRGLFITFLVTNTVLLSGWRIFLRLSFRYHAWSRLRKNVVIVGAGQTGQRVANFMVKYGSDRVNVLGYFDDNGIETTEGDVTLPQKLALLGSISQLVDYVKQATNGVDDVIIALPLDAYERINWIIHQLAQQPVQVRVVPDYFNLALYRARVDTVGGLPLINIRAPALGSMQRLIKRVFDLIIALLSVVLLSPIFILSALAIKLDSKGAVFFRQMRVGENGKLFAMYKFRSMCIDAETIQLEIHHAVADGKLLHKRCDDPRVTRIGRILRRLSIDELPQLFNVLRGDMSLVGPRPELPWLVEQYQPWQRTRFAVPQGMTGWWQVNGRSDKPMHLHTNEDLFYIQNYSLWMDLYILLRTPLVVLRGKGAF